ncbi:hypothetical protein ANCCEY_12168 [Ancylostoma ceylanicum]|uniref:Uncharacterized protein n=1 Tax=Ancylostoma ceylanicum TaxID=53326 RepID=A0A0D6LBU4_9BILA|nr:hypothetical protein ANCCEY_12168 [Ancylostoma ceylanicum]
MEAGDLRVPEIPLAPGEDDLDSNKNSQQELFPTKIAALQGKIDPSLPPVSGNSAITNPWL